MRHLASVSMGVPGELFPGALVGLFPGQIGVLCPGLGENGVLFPGMFPGVALAVNVGPCTL